MGKLKIILISLCSALIVCSVLLAVFRNSIAESILVWSLESLTGHQVLIEGPVVLDFSLEPSLSVSDMRIVPDRDDGQGLTAHLGGIRTKIALQPLLSRIVLIRELSVNDGTISFVDENGSMPAHRDDKPLRERLAHIHIPVVENISVDNISVNYRDMESGYALDVILDSLTVDDVRDEGPLSVKGEGALNETPFSLDGRLGSVADAIKHALPYPVDMRFALSDLAFTISGNVDDILALKGLDLFLAIDEPEVSNVLKVLKLDTPELGHLDIEARITGDVTAPGIADLSVNLSGVPGIAFSAKGSVVNLMTGEGTDVKLTGSCQNIDLIREMLPEELHAMDEFTAEGRLRSSRGEFTIEDVNLTAITTKESRTTASGNIILGENIFDPSGFRGDLRLHMEAASSKLLRAILFDWLPDTGPVIGEARATGHLKDPALEDITITAGVPKGAMITARGRIGSIPLAPEIPVSGVDMSLSVESQNVKQLFANIKAKIPELDRISAVIRIHGSSDRLVFEDIKAEMKDFDGVEARTSGTFTLEDREEGLSAGLFDLDVTVTAPQLSSFRKLLAARTLPELGPVNVSAHISGNTDVMSLENISLQAGRTRDVTYGWQGRIGRVPFTGDEPVSEVEIISILHAQRTSLLSPYVGFSVPDLGPIEGSSRIVARPGGYGYDDIEIIIGDKDDYRLKATGNMEYVMRGTEVAFEGADLSVDIRQLDSAPVLASLGHKADLGTISGNIAVSGDLSDFALPDIRLSSVSSRGVNISAYGAVQHIRIEGEKHIEGIRADITAQGPDMISLKELTGIDLPDLGPFTLQVNASDRVGAVIIDEIHLLTGEKEKPTLRVDGQMHDVLSRERIDFSGSFDAAVRPWSMKFLEHEMPEDRRMEGKFALTGTIDQLSVQGSARLGETSIQADVLKSGGKERPHVTARVSAPKIYLDDLGIYPGAAEEKGDEDTSPPSPPGKKIFGESPLPFEKMPATDISLDIDVGEVVGKDFTLRDLDFDVTVEQGLVVLKPAGMKYADGFVSLESTIDRRTEKPGLTLKVTAEDIDTAELFAYLRFPWMSAGHLNIAADLRSSGESPREIASALQGEFGMAVENGRVRRIVDYLGADALDFVTTVHKAREEQQLNCLALKFHFEEGIGTSDIIYSDTPEVRSQGTGTINLKDETIDLVIQPTPKRGQIGGSSPVTLTGPLNSPSVRKLPFIEAARLAGEILMPYAFLPARAAGYVWYLMKDDRDEESPCLRTEE